MSQKDFVDQLATVVRLAEERIRLSNKFKSCRRTTENDEVTIERLLRERTFVCKLLHDAELRAEPFDYEFTQNFTEKVSEFVALLKEKSK